MWHYRVFKVIPKKQPRHFYYCIKEYYPNVKRAGWSRDEMAPGGRTKKELIDDLENMLVDARRYRVRVEYVEEVVK